MQAAIATATNTVTAVETKHQFRRVFLLNRFLSLRIFICSNQITKQEGGERINTLKGTSHTHSLAEIIKAYSYCIVLTMGFP